MKFYFACLFVLIATGVFAENQQVDLTIFGMDCAVCAHTLRVSLGGVEGVNSVDVSINQGVAKISLKQGNQVTLDKLRTVVKSIGFLPKDITLKCEGTVALENGKPMLHVSGTSEVYDVAMAADARKTVSDWNQYSGQPLVVEGTIQSEGKQSSTHISIHDLWKP